MIDPSLVDGGSSIGSPGPSWGGMPRPEYRPRNTADGIPEAASFGRRLSAWLIDLALFFVIALIFASSLLATAGIDLEAVEREETQALEDIGTVYGVTAVLGFGYFWIWNAIGYTPGKQMLGMRIVDGEGRPPGWGRGFARTVGFVPSLLVLALGYLWMLWDGKRQTWHDKQASTFVVREQSRRR